MRKRILFVCDYNQNRSPTFAKWFNENVQDVHARSAGAVSEYFKSDLDWAEHVFVMDLNQHMIIEDKYLDQLKKVQVVGVSDIYDPEDPLLLEIINHWYIHVYTHL